MMHWENDFMALEQFAYLMLRVGSLGKPPQMAIGPVEAGMKSGCSEFLMKGWTARIPVHGMGGNSGSRMFFALRKHGCDDSFAERIAECVIVVFELFGGPLILAPEVENLVLRLPFHFCSPKHPTLKLERLAQAAIANNTTKMWAATLPSQIVQCSYVDAELLGLGWALVPYVIKNQWLHDSLAFYSASIRRFYVWDVDVI
jgi:hypothetical protein